MSLLPESETDIAALTNQGFRVIYSDGSNDEIYELVELPDSLKETVVDQSGVIDSPGELPSVKYYDRDTKKLFAALWIKKGKNHRFEGPSMICERDNYTIQVYHIDDKLHHAHGPAIIVDDRNDQGGTIRSTEGYYFEGNLHYRIDRDPFTGEIEHDTRWMEDEFSPPPLPQP